MSWEEDIEKHLHLFAPDKRNFQPEELYVAYRIYNSYYGTNMRDTGCGSCRRSIISHCRKIASDWEKKKL